MAIMAVVSIMAFVSMDAASRIAVAIQQDMEKTQRLNQGFILLANDLQQIMPRTVRDPNGEPNEFLEAFIANGDDALLTLTRGGWVNPLPEVFQRSDMQRVSYVFDGESLIRSYWPTLDRYSYTEPRSMVLIDGLQDVSVRVLKRKSITAANVRNNGLSTSRYDTEWVDEWPELSIAVIDKRLLPEALEIRLTFEDLGEVVRRFELVDNE